MSAEPHVLTCPSCGGAQPATKFQAITCHCRSCGHQCSLELPTDGALRVPTLGLKALLRRAEWVAALTSRAQENTVIIDVCPECEGPLVVAQSAPLALACAFCGAHHTFALGEHVADALPTFEVKAATWGGGMQLSWSPEHHEAATDRVMDCPRCGAPVAPFEGLTQCAHCHNALLALTACGRRVLPGVRIRGDDEGQHVDCWVPLHEAFAHFEQRRVLVRHARKTTCGLMAVVVIGGPIYILLVVVVAIIAGIAVGPEGAMAVVLVGAGGMLPLWVLLLIWTIVRARKKRRELVDAKDGR